MKGSVHQFDVSALIERWRRFWFEEIPPHPFALLRILMGTLGLLGLLGLTPISMFWTLDGLTPIAGGGLGLKSTLIRYGLGSLTGELLFATLFAGFAAMTVGYKSGLAVAIGFMGSVFQIRWNRLPLSSAHQVLTSVLFCLVWADTGAVWSLDRWLERRRRPAAADEPPPTQPIWPLQMIRYQIALIYLNSGLWKLFGPMWREGSALHYALNLNAFRRFAHVLPPQLEWAATLGTYVTLFWEIGFAFMVLHPKTRRVALVLGVLFHLGLFLTLELGPFSWVMIASYVAFVDPYRVSRWFSWAREKPIAATAAPESV